MHDEIVQCLLFEKALQSYVYDYGLNDESTETDQFVARIHK